jgi:threonine aldolase
LLAEGLAGLHGIGVDPVTVRTDIVYFRLMRDDLTAEALARRLNDAGVRILALGPNRLRAVTNYHVTTEDIYTAVRAFTAILT